MLHELNKPTLCPRQLASCKRCRPQLAPATGKRVGQHIRINDSPYDSGNSTSATKERLRIVKDGITHARCIMRIPKVSLPLFQCQLLQLFLCVSAACLLQLPRADHAAKAVFALAASQSRAVPMDVRLPGRRLLQGAEIIT